MEESACNNCGLDFLRRLHPDLQTGRLFSQQFHPFGQFQMTQIPLRQTDLEYSGAPSTLRFNSSNVPCNQDPSAIDDGDLICQDLDLGEVVRTQHNRPLGGFQTRDLIPHQPRRLRVHGGGGFVQQQHAGVVHHGARQCQFLAHPFRIFANPALRRFSQTKILQQIIAARFTQGRRKVIHLTEKIQIFDAVMRMYKPCCSVNTPTEARTSCPFFATSYPATRAQPREG
jgi:hypothetical protein